MTFPSDLHDDYTLYGFKADQIYPFLAKHGINLERKSDIPSPPINVPVEQRFPEWKRVLAVSPYLSIIEAAHALANVDPDSPGWPTDDEQAKINKYRKLVGRSIEARDPGERLAAIEQRDPETGEADWEIRPADFAAWCTRKGIEYPLPSLTPRPATNAEALAEIGRLRQELAELQKPAVATQPIEFINDANDDEISAIECCAELEVELARAGEEIERLKIKAEKQDRVEAENTMLKYEVTRLSERLVGNNREIARLNRSTAINTALAVTQQKILKRRLEQEVCEIDRLRAALPESQSGAALFGVGGKSGSSETLGGVTILVPHVTKRFELFLGVMRNHWTEYRKDAPPKSANVARDIDEALGYKKPKNGGPSREAQTLAALIRPDEERDADLRVARR